LVQLLRSAPAVHIEDVLSGVQATLTVVHAERDRITSHAYAARLAAERSARLVVVPGATHSWPYGDPERFADLVEEVLR
jgi:pimeloyl-ACP methyl ester carboxylesterase